MASSFRPTSSRCDEGPAPHRGDRHRPGRGARPGGLDPPVGAARPVARRPLPGSPVHPRPAAGNAAILARGQRERRPGHPAPGADRRAPCAAERRRAARYLKQHARRAALGRGGRRRNAHPAEARPVGGGRLRIRQGAIPDPCMVDRSRDIRCVASVNRAVHRHLHLGRRRHGQPEPRRPPRRLAGPRPADGRQRHGERRDGRRRRERRP